MSSPQDPGERFRLPDSVARGGGPVAGNPFPFDDPLHRVWAEGTRKAEETVNRLTADGLSTEEPYTAAWAATLIVAKFDAWAERGVSVVWCDRALQHCDQWLVAEANAWIDRVARTCAAAAPPFSVNTLLTDLRRRLSAQVYGWKAAARHVCADYQAAISSPSAAPPGSSESMSDPNPYPEGDPDHQAWMKTDQSLADTLARIHAAFFLALPRRIDAATVVEWLAGWTVSYFDAIAKVHVMAVVKDEEAGADAFAAALNACRVQTLGVLNQQLARCARQMEGLMNAFPGATACNIESVRFVDDVQSRVTPEVTRRLVERLAEWLVQACRIDREIDPMRYAPETVASPDLARAVETASAGVAAPQTDSRLSPQEADRMVSSRATPGEEVNGPTLPRETVAPPAQRPMSARGWEDIEIRFLSDFKFQALVNGIVQAPQNYADAGFGDGRHGRPKAAWETLRALAESGGVISSTRTAAEWPKLEKRIQEIRKLLRACFALKGDPIPYVKSGYRTRFTIRLSPSYER